MIANTTTDLKEHLLTLDHRLQTLSLKEARISNEDMAERDRIQEERDSIEQCLTVCAHASKYIQNR
jgi:hypothetical protein